MDPTLWLVWAGGYLLGSIPFGVVFSRLFGLGDLRQIGSGNIGATNVLRTGHKGAAALTLLFDGGKGAVAVLATLHFGPSLAAAIARPEIFAMPTPTAALNAAAVAGFGAFLGHLYPVWLWFRGGKGVATFLGIFLALAWPAGLAACGVWLGMAVLFRRSSLAALSAAAAMPFLLARLAPEETVWLGVLLGALLFFTHAANIERLFLGTEPRIGRR